MIIHMLKSIGPVMGTILGLLSVSLVALIVLLAMDVRMGDSVPPAFVEEFTEIVNKRQFKEAYELAKNDNSFLARVLTAGMGRLQYGIEDARETAMNMVESIKAGKEQLITYLATIGTPRADARPGRHGVRHDRRLHGAGRPAPTPNPHKLAEHLARPGGHAAGHRPVGAGHLLPRLLPQPPHRASRWTRPTSPTTC